MAGMMGGMELGMGQPSTGMYAGPYPGHAGGRGGVRHAAAPLAAAALKGAHTQTPYAAFLQHASHAAPLQRMPEGFYQPRVDSRSGFRDLSSDAELHPSSHPIFDQRGPSPQVCEFSCAPLTPSRMPSLSKALIRTDIMHHSPDVIRHVGLRFYYFTQGESCLTLLQPYSLRS